MARVGNLLLHLPDDHYTQIGAVITKWATLEFQMMAIIWRAMELDNIEGRVLTVGMGTQVLCGILRNLPKKWIVDNDVKADVIKLTDGVSKYAEGRNFLAHGIWTVFPDDSAPYLNFMKKAEHRILPAAQPVKPDELKLFSQILDQLNLLANGILGRLGGDVAPASPDKPDEQNPAGLPTQTQIPQ
jgi:hypothetical protein